MTIMKPLHSGTSARMHSKQPHEVMGFCMREYRLMLSIARFEFV